MKPIKNFFPLLIYNPNSYKLRLSSNISMFSIEFLETNNKTDMKIIKLKNLEVRVLSLNAFVEVFKSNREKEQVVEINLPCKIAWEKGNLIIYVRNDVYGPAAELYYDAFYGDLRANGLKRDAIEEAWKILIPELLGM